MRSNLAALFPLLLLAVVARGAAPDDGGLTKAASGFDAASGALARSTDTMLKTGPLCQATYMMFVSPGAKAAEELREPQPGTDGKSRDVPATIAYRRARVTGLVQALQKKIAAGALKAEESGDGTTLLKDYAAAAKELDAAIAAEIAQTRARMAAGAAKKNSTFGRGAMSAVREQTVDVNCQKFIQAVDGSDALNNSLIARMEEIRKMARDYQKTLGTWAAGLKKPTPPTPATPIPAAPPAPVTPPAPPKPAAPKSVPAPVPVAPPAAVEPNPAAPKPPGPPPSDKPNPPQAPAPPRETVEVITPPAAALIAPTETPVIPASEVKTEAPPPPVTAYTLDADCVKQLTNTIPFKHAEAILQFLRKTEGIGNEPKKAKDEQQRKDARGKPDLRRHILAEGKGVDASETGIVAYDPSRDRWTTNGPMAWKKYDREKRALGKRVAPPVTEKEFAAAAKRLGGRLASEENRVRLQMAINEAAGAGKKNGPTVFQDGVLGSRTRNAVVYYLKQHPQEFRRALERQGFRPEAF